MTSATLIKQAREAAGLTQAELARRLGSSQPAVARLESPVANPTWGTLIRALRAAGYGVRLVPLSPPAVTLDLDQLRERLAMSPGQRLRSFQESQASLERLRRTSRRRTA